MQISTASSWELGALYDLLEDMILQYTPQCGTKKNQIGARPPIMGTIHHDMQLGVRRPTNLDANFQNPRDAAYNSQQAD